MLATERSRTFAFGLSIKFACVKSITMLSLPKRLCSRRTRISDPVAAASLSSPVFLLDKNT